MHPGVASAQALVQLLRNTFGWGAALVHCAKAQKSDQKAKTERCQNLPGDVFPNICEGDASCKC